MAKSVLILILNVSFIGAGLAATSHKVVEKKFSFPPPVQWRVGQSEVSVVGVAWGPASSLEMISKGHEEPATDKPVFFPDRPYALAVKLRGVSLNPVMNRLVSSSRLLLIKDVNGDYQMPMELTPKGFVHYSGAPGVYDLVFDRGNTTEFWDFFPVSPHQQAFLFQSFGSSYMQSGRGRSRTSFRVLIRNNDLELVNVTPGHEGMCTKLSQSFSGTIGSGTTVNLQLAIEGTDLSGTERYTRIGKTLWVSGQVDLFGNFILNEQYPKKRLTGIFKGTFSRGCQSMGGYFSKSDGSGLLPFEFNQDTAPTK